MSKTTQQTNDLMQRVLDILGDGIERDVNVLSTLVIQKGLPSTWKLDSGVWQNTARLVYKLEALGLVEKGVCYQRGWYHVQYWRVPDALLVRDDSASSWKRCVKCGEKLLRYEARECSESNMPGSCRDCRQSVIEEVSKDASMWPSGWFGHWMRSRMQNLWQWHEVRAHIHPLAAR